MYEGQTSDALWRLSSSSSSVTLHGGPVTFRSVRATLCLVSKQAAQKVDDLFLPYVDVEIYLAAGSLSAAIVNTTLTAIHVDV